MSGVRPRRRTGVECSGFILLPVTLTLSLLASIAYLANRDSGTGVAMVSGRSETEKARYAAEAGLEHINYLLQQKGCLGTFPLAATPLVNTNFGGAQYEAFASLASGSPVQLTSTGMYNGASVTLTRSNVIVYQSLVPPPSYTIQRALPVVKGAPNDPVRDTYLSDKRATTNYGGEKILKIRRNRDFLILLKFVMSTLPAGSRPVSTYASPASPITPGAKLSLYQTSGGATVLSAQLGQTSWIEGNGAGGSNLNTSDGSTPWPTGLAYHPVAVAAETPSDVAGWKSWNVTSAAALWLSDPQLNHGLWLLASGDADRNVEYFSSEETQFPVPPGGNLRPKLELNYLLPCGAVAPP